MRTKNIFELRGYAGVKPEILEVGEGKKVCNISLATSYINSKTSEEVAEWHSVKVWGKLAEAANKYIEKGTLVIVEGRICPKKYENKEGVKVYAVELVAKSLDIFPKKKAEAAPEEVKEPDTKKSDPKPKEKKKK